MNKELDVKARELITKIQNGDTEAEKELASMYDKYVTKVAEEYADKGISTPDLIAAGTEGLVKASHKFDLAKDFTFISYAIHWVRQEILQAFAKAGLLDNVKAND